MRYDTIADVFTANDVFRKQFLETVGNISDAEAELRPDGEKWSISEVAEHLALVDQGISRICKKLIAEARVQGRESDGTIRYHPISGNARQKLQKKGLKPPRRCCLSATRVYATLWIRFSKIGNISKDCVTI